MSDSAIEIITDGGVDAGGAASACLLRVGSHTRKVVVMLPSCESSTAELVAGVLGLHVVPLVSVTEAFSVTWSTDSKMAVQGMCEHIALWKQQDWMQGSDLRRDARLWQELDLFQSNYEVAVHHVVGHDDGSPIEACHRACRWVQGYGDKLLARFGEGPIGRMRERNPAEAWHLVDLRQFATDAVEQWVSRVHEVLRASPPFLEINAAPPACE